MRRHEAAGHDALRSYAEAVLRADKDLMGVAVGAFADAGLWERARGSHMTVVARSTFHRAVSVTST